MDKAHHARSARGEPATSAPTRRRSVFGAFAVAIGLTGAAAALPVDRASAAAPPGATGYVAATLGSDSSMWVNKNGAWTGTGGILLFAPAVAVLPGATNTVFYIGVGANHDVFVRSDSAGWAPATASPVYCNDLGAFVDAGGILHVACQGHDKGLWGATSTAPLSPSGANPTLGGWAALGGIIGSGPALDLVNGVLTYVAWASDGFLWNRTDTVGWTRVAAGAGMFCSKNRPALQSAGIAYLGCRVNDGSLWVTVNNAGTWSAPRLVGGRQLYGPGVAAYSDHAIFFVEGGDKALWKLTVDATGGLLSVMKLGGSVKLGLAASAF